MLILYLLINLAVPLESSHVAFIDGTACQRPWAQLGRYVNASTFRMGNGGFVIKSTLVSKLNGKYTPGQQYSLDLIGLVAPYEGFVIQARDRWNEGLILGSFIPLDTSKAQTIHCLGNEQGTVIHKTKDPVSVQSFIWQAPSTSVGSGEVDFVYSVMQSSLEHWVRINASSDLSYEGVLAHDAPPMDASCPPGPSPSAVYRFTTTSSADCVQSTCDYFLGIRTNDNDPTYLDFVLEGKANGWIGIGFAIGPSMPSADVLGCVLVSGSSEVAIVDAWNVAGGHSNARDNIQNVCPHSSSYSNGRIQCVFSRQIITNDIAQDVPMNGTYYLLYGRGNSPTASSPPALTFHGVNFLPPISGYMVDPLTAAGNASASNDDPIHSVMVRVHGVVMTVAFSIFGVIGIFSAAWMKPVLVQGCWYKLHRGMMIASLLLGTFGFICIFVAHRKETYRGFYGLVPLDNPGDTVHFTLGVVGMVMLIANPVIAIFRCKPDAPRRWIYNLIHGAIVGLVFEVLVLANSCLGLYLLGGAGTMFFLYIFFVAFTVLMYSLLLFSTTFVTEPKGGTPAVVRLVQSCVPVVQRRLFSNEARFMEESVPLIGEEHRDSERVLMNAAIRWATFCFYVSVSVSVLVTVATMVTLQTVD